MHAYCLSGGTREDRQKEITIRLQNAGVMEIDKVYLEKDEIGEHIGISAVRTFTKRLLLTPQLSKYTAGIILDAYLLTTEAQNALLKLLEEPPPHVLLYLETVHHDQLLPTVVSRCQTIQLVETTNTDGFDNIMSTIQSLSKASPGEKLRIIDGIVSDRDATKQWIQTAISATRRHMLLAASESFAYTTLLRRFITAQRELSVNVNPRLVLDTVFLP